MSTTHAKLMDELKALHDKKAADYANEKNRYANFERAAEIASWFSDPVDKVFATMLGIKLARIAELTQDGRVAQNESLDDSFVDLTNYCAIWTSYRRDRRAFTQAIDEEMAKEMAKWDAANRKVDKQVNPGTYGPGEHVIYPKTDGTCCICGMKVTDKEGRERSGCRPHSLEYVYQSK